MTILAAAVSSACAAEYKAPDGSFAIQVMNAWRARATPQGFTVVEPSNGSDERIVVGAGVLMANSIQQLSQQAMGIAGQFFPGASLLSGPKVATRGGLPFAEQEYQTARIRAWNGMWMKGEFYFAVLAIARPQRYAEVRKAAQELMQTAVFQGLQRNMNLEGALLGSWSKSSYSATRTGVRDKSNYSANWTVRFFPGNRFESTQENYFDTTSEVYGGGNVGSSNRATGTYRIFGMTMVADMDGGAGRQLFQLEPYPNGQAIKVNGQLFLRN